MQVGVAAGVLVGMSEGVLVGSGVAVGEGSAHADSGATAIKPSSPIHMLFRIAGVYSDDARDFKTESLPWGRKLKPSISGNQSTRHLGAIIVVGQG